ncbi:PREDICTED: UV-stimulated scaffold protein A [Myotis davidii]|uniref:UV-stimulated scaffold protein A n=1 Tax=Myotis davidii TaxID=225400 RepID=UPI00076719FB|nr:PREDICTED: UV-stimulated scaffold protein A [Myotis davidii]
MDQRLSELIEDLTTSGEPRLDPERMKELKKMCKSSEEQLSRAYHLLTAQLRQEHAEVRLSAFQVAEELFARSHLFRLLVVSDFQGFLELTLGTDPRQPLPPPREAAQRLRQAAARAVQGWSEKFGAAYKKLSLGYHFLRHSQQVDFQDVNARTLAERKREEEKQRRLDRIYRERSEQAVREMEAPPTPAFAFRQPGCEHGEVALSLARARRPVATTGASGDEEESDQEDFVRRHGLGSHKYTLDVELSGSLRVQEDEDNCAVIQSARDALKLIQNKFLPAVRTWVQLFTRAGARGQHLEAAIDLKAELETALRRSQELDIEPEGPRRRETAALGDEDEDEDDGDFVEVPEKEGYEACVPEHLWPEDGSERDLAAQGLLARKRRRTDEEASDPTSAAAQLHRLRGHLPPAPCLSPRGVGSPLLVDEEVDSPEVSEVLRSRHITFAGSFEPVQHRCRAPRPDGRLCERQDRLKCPFHGKIIPRDDTGRPLQPEDRAREQRQQLQRQAGRSDWQDPEFMRDVEVATGVDLGSSRAGRRGKGRKRRHPGLTDLKQQADTARTRIAKKVFARAAVQRVVTAMNQMDQKKHEKFANQFNYALS